MSCNYYSEAIMTFKERLEMYMELSKEELATMLASRDMIEKALSKQPNFKSDDLVVSTRKNIFEDY